MKTVYFMHADFELESLMNQDKAGLERVSFLTIHDSDVLPIVANLTDIILWFAEQARLENDPEDVEFSENYIKTIDERQRALLGKGFIDEVYVFGEILLNGMIEKIRLAHRLSIPVVFENQELEELYEDHRQA